MKYLIKKPQTFFTTINDEIGSILHRTFDNMFPEYLFNSETTGFTLPVDIKEFDNEYKIKVELPGIPKDNIDIELTKNNLKIKAQKEENKSENNQKYHKTEFNYGFYSRQIMFPEEIDTEKSTAKLENGILILDIPKIKEKEKESKQLKIE